MAKQIIFFIFTILLLGLFASASPLPVPRDAAAAKRGLRQFKLKRGDPEPFAKRADDDAPKPSSTPYIVNKRDDVSPPQPSKSASSSQLSSLPFHRTD
ncbi:hypothetical protein D9758_001507 [Tetrapyrgos nigripes]|uniref:Uncharacterized protein n=1 Tax=Tetrapyrgos nigripes TaxID=182062 RepID=A0A8H5LXL2_9AGAR|nr:hypothetical protein D9758_001507 [Tetrapyrgos nigripes]